jgi:hypothetical protein
MPVTEGRMEIDDSDEHPANADGSMDDGSDGDSKVTVERDQQPQKHSWASFSTAHGI